MILYLLGVRVTWFWDWRLNKAKLFSFQKLTEIIPFLPFKLEIFPFFCGSLSHPQNDVQIIFLRIKEKAKIF